MNYLYKFIYTLNMKLLLALLFLLVIVHLTQSNIIVNLKYETSSNCSSTPNYIEVAPYNKQQNVIQMTFGELFLYYNTTRLINYCNSTNDHYFKSYMEVQLIDTTMDEFKLMWKGNFLAVRYYQEFNCVGGNFYRYYLSNCQKNKDYLYPGYYLNYDCNDEIPIVTLSWTSNLCGNPYLSQIQIGPENQRFTYCNTAPYKFVYKCVINKDGIIPVFSSSLTISLIGCKILIFCSILFIFL